jgi:hypothetical protein
MPTTTNFGWTTPADTDLVKDGAAAIRTLGSGIDTSLVDLKGGTTGQVLSKATNTDLDFTWAAAPGASALTLVSATTFSGVSSHSVNNCFTSTYRYYRILCDFTEAFTTNRNLLFRLRASSTDSTASYNAVDVYGYNAVVGAETDVQGTDEFFLGGVGANMTLGHFKADLFAPQLAAPTGIQWGLAGYQSASFFSYTGIGVHTASTSYDGFTIYTSSENITGTIKVYGYQN